MNVKDIFYNKQDYVETASGNKVCRQTFLYGAQNILLQGKVIVQSDVIIRGDLAGVKAGRYCIISRDAVLRPPYKKFNRGLTFFPLHIGDHVFLGEDSVVSAALVGSYVYVGKNVVIFRWDQIFLVTNRAGSQEHEIMETIKHRGGPTMVWCISFFFSVEPQEEIQKILTRKGRRCVLRDACMIEDNTILPPDTIVPSFTRIGPSLQLVEELPECTPDLMIDYTRSYYEHFIPRDNKH